MQQGLKLDEEVPVKLTDDQLLARGQTLAEQVAYRETLVTLAKADAAKWRAQITGVDEEIARLGRVILSAYEMRKQGDLFVLDPAGATAALAEVARRVEGGNGGVASEG
jgi:hypothetical protein